MLKSSSAPLYTLVGFDTRQGRFAKGYKFVITINKPGSNELVDCEIVNKHAHYKRTGIFRRNGPTTMLQNDHFCLHFNHHNVHCREEYENVAFLYVSDDMAWGKKNIKNKKKDLVRPEPATTSSKT